MSRHRAPARIPAATVLGGATAGVLVAVLAALATSTTPSPRANMGTAWPGSVRPRRDPPNALNDTKGRDQIADRLRSRKSRDTRVDRAAPRRPDHAPSHHPGREVAAAAVTAPTCRYERFPDRHTAELALTERRARAALAGSPLTVERVAHPCEQCGGAHILRATPSAPGAAA